MSQSLYAVTFDAVGTLFAVREPVGSTYGELARAQGFAAANRDLGKAFARAVRNAPPLATPGSLDASHREGWVRQWWRNVVGQCLGEVIGSEPATLAKDKHFEQFFEAAFSHYGDANAWKLFDESVPTLDEARTRGLRVGILSNFDDRLDGVLKGLGIRHYFDDVVVSTQVGVAKPARAIFEHARRGLGDEPAERYLHVGDSLSLDAQGALDAGWRAAWLDRGQEKEPAQGVLRPRTLDELFPLLDAQ